MQNELDDKADMKDGLTQTKGKKRNAAGDYNQNLKIVPRAHNTKLYKMLEQLKDILEVSEGIREEVKGKNEMATRSFRDSDFELEDSQSEIVQERPHID